MTHLPLDHKLDVTPSRTVQTDQEMSDKVSKTVLIMQSRDKSWSSSTECERENISLDFPRIWTYCQLKRIHFHEHQHTTLSLSPSNRHTQTHKQHEFADTAPGAIINILGATTAICSHSRQVKIRSVHMFSTSQVLLPLQQFPETPTSTNYPNTPTCALTNQPNSKS